MNKQLEDFVFSNTILTEYVSYAGKQKILNSSVAEFEYSSCRPEAVSMSQSLAYQFEVLDAHTQRRIRNVTTTTPSIHLKSLPPSSDFLVYIYSISKSGRSEPIRLEGFTTRFV